MFFMHMFFFPSRSHCFSLYGCLANMFRGYPPSFRQVKARGKAMPELQMFQTFTFFKTSVSTHPHVLYFLHDKTVSKSFKKGLKIGRSTYQMKAWWKWNAVFVRYLLRIWAMKLNFGQSTLHCSNSIWRKLLVGSATFESHKTGAWGAENLQSLMPNPSSICESADKPL